MLELLANQQLLFGLLGGLGLFLFGMKTLSEGLQKIAGERMRRILAALTANRLVGTLVGLAVTAIVQSSSATTVLVVGFVNAGLMSLVQAIGVVLGANIGTTLTAQLIAFKISAFALPVIGIGAGLKLFSRNRNWSYFGEVILGFGLLFFGLALMKQGFDPLKGSEEFREVFLMVGDNPLLGVLVGALLTFIVQSSTATIGITLALASSGLLTYQTSVFLILGENIGTTCTANIAAIGANLPARRTAFAHFAFNAIGVVYMLLLMPYFIHLVDLITPGDPDFILQTEQQVASLGGSLGDKPFIARHIANAHTLFNVINTLVFLPFVGLLAKISSLLIRGREMEGEFQLKYIDHRVLNTPPIALGQARAETRRMGQLGLDSVADILRSIDDGIEKRMIVLQQREEQIDGLQREITDFLVSLSQQSITRETSTQIASMMHIVNDLERIGDYCQNLGVLMQKKSQQRIIFSPVADGGLSELAAQCYEFLVFTMDALENNNGTILVKAQSFEDCIDRLEQEQRDNHIKRLNTGECAVQPGLIFIDILHNFEKIGDHTFNIAKAISKRN